MSSNINNTLHSWTEDSWKKWNIFHNQVIQSTRLWFRHASKSRSFWSITNLIFREWKEWIHRHKITKTNTNTYTNERTNTCHTFKWNKRYIHPFFIITSWCMVWESTPHIDSFHFYGVRFWVRICGKCAIVQTK